MITTATDNRSALATLAEQTHELPPLELLEPSAPQAVTSSDELAKQGQMILCEFDRRGVEVELFESLSTSRLNNHLFGFPYDGTSQIAKVDETLRRMLEIALGVTGVSIEAPVPDTSLIAVEVPRKIDGGPVRLAEFVKQARSRQSIIPCALGEDSRGQARIIDLATDCHQLIAGQTGGGKSIFLKSMVLTIGMCCAPHRVRLVIVDGKGLDLAGLSRLPHCACPVITDSNQANRVLRWLGNEMVRRQVILREAGVSDIWSYSASSDNNGRDDKEELPAIVAIIDEVQVLTQNTREQAEPLLRLLSQQGRACGILLVLATQRPTVDILQGGIKANVPGRISFRLPTQVDSRVILDQGGAELLRGPGDMIAIEASMGGAARMQAPLIDDGEIERVCEFFDDRPKTKPLIDLGARACFRLPAGPATDSSGDRGRPQSQDTEELDDLALGASPRQFAQIQLREDQLLETLKRDYPDRHIAISLTYFPFVHGLIRARFAKRPILFDPASGWFLRSAAPLAAVPLWPLFEDLEDSQPIVVDLIKNPGQALSYDDDRVPLFWPLVDRGILMPAANGLRLRRDLAQPPILVDRVQLEMLPRRNAELYPTPADLPERIGRLRRSIGELWHRGLEALTLIGMPFHQALIDEQHLLTFGAWAPDTDPRDVRRLTWVASDREAFLSPIATILERTAI